MFLLKMLAYRKMAVAARDSPFKTSSSWIDQKTRGFEILAAALNLPGLSEKHKCR